MQVNRNSHFVLQCTYQFLRSHRLQQTGHILDCDDMRTSLLQFLRHVYIVLQVVLLSGFIQDISGVAHGGFRNLTLIQGLIDSDFHALNPVQGVEDTEYIDSGLRGLTDELPNGVIRIVPVSYRIRTAEQHLEHNIRNLFTQGFQSFPRIFAQETHRYVEGRAAPHFEGEEILPVSGHCRCNLHQILGSHSSGNQ